MDDIYTIDIPATITRLGAAMYKFDIYNLILQQYIYMMRHKRIWIGHILLILMEMAIVVLDIIKKRVLFLQRLEM